MSLKYHLILDEDYWNQEKREKLDKIKLLVEKQISDILIVDSPSKADILLIWWWDGFMLESIKKYKDYGKLFFWINAWTVWFMLNHMVSKNLPTSLDEINLIDIPLIPTSIIDWDNNKIEKYFINDVLLWSYGGNFHNFEISSTTEWKLINILCSELLINTPLWSTWQALNGDLPLMDINSKLLGVTCAWPKWFSWWYLKSKEVTIKDVRWRDMWHVAHDWKNPKNMIKNAKEITIHPPKQFIQIWFKKDENYHDRRILLAQESLWNVILWKSGWLIN